MNSNLTNDLNQKSQTPIKDNNNALTSHQMGKNAAKEWLTGKPALSLCQHRALCFAKAFVNAPHLQATDLTGFKAGYASAIAKHIARGSNEYN